MFRNWFRPFTGHHSRNSTQVRRDADAIARRKRAGRVRLGIEMLETRLVPTIVFPAQFGAESPSQIGGASLSSTTVHLVFWGPSSYWTGPQMAQYTSAAESQVASGYLSGLTQYGSDGLATVDSTFIADQNQLPGSVNEATADTEVERYILTGQLPFGTGHDIYAVVTPSTEPQSFYSGGAVGYNWTDSSLLTGYMPLIWDGNTANVDGFTRALGHELVEETSDPGGNGFEVYHGAQLPNPPFASGQIGDFEAQNYPFRLTNGVQVQPYWSQADNAFIVPDGTALKQFFIAPDSSGSGYDLTVLGGQAGTTSDQFAVGTTTVVVGGNTLTETYVSANGESVMFDAGILKTVNFAGSTGTDTLTLNSLPSGVKLSITSSSNVEILYTGTANVKGTVNALVDGKLTVSDQAAPGNHTASMDGTSITLDQNAPLSYTLDALSQSSLEVDTAWATGLTINNTPLGSRPLTIVTTGKNNQIALERSSGPVTINATAGDDITVGNGLLSELGGAVTVNGANQLTVKDNNDAAPGAITITGTAVQYGFGLTISYQNIQALIVDGGSGGLHNQFTVQSTAAGTPVTISTFSGTNEVDVNGAASFLTILDGGTDTIKLGPTQGMNPIGNVLVNGDGTTALTVNDQVSVSGSSTINLFQPNIQYTVTSNTVTRTVTYPSLPTLGGGSSTTTITYNGLGSLTLNAANVDNNVVNIEGTSAATNVNAGTTTTRINVSPKLQNLDNIGAALNIAGGSAALNVYDQLNVDGTATYPLVYALADGVVRSRHVGSSVVQTNITAWGLPGFNLTLYTSPNPNQVNAGYSFFPTAIISGAADAITVSGFGGPLTVNGHGGTLTVNDGMQNTSGAYLSNTYTDGFTVTSQTVTRSQTDHEEEYIDPAVIAEMGAFAAKVGLKAGWNSFYTTTSGTLNYQNIKSLAIDGTAVADTFTVQSTASGVPVTLTGGSVGNSFVIGNGSVKNILSQVKITSGTASDTVLLDDSQATSQDKVTVSNGATGDVQLGMAATDQFFGSQGGLDCFNIPKLTLNLSAAANDSVHLTPSAVTAFFLNGNASEFAAGAGAALSLDLTGLATELLTQTGPGAGNWTFGGVRKAVTFQNMH